MLLCREHRVIINIKYIDFVAKRRRELTSSQTGMTAAYDRYDRCCHAAYVREQLAASAVNCLREMQCRKETALACKLTHRRKQWPLTSVIRNILISDGCAF